MPKQKPKIVKYAGEPHYADCAFIHTDQGVCNCKEKLKAEQPDWEQKLPDEQKSTNPDLYSCPPDYCMRGKQEKSTTKALTTETIWKRGNFVRCHNCGDLVNVEVELKSAFEAGKKEAVEEIKKKLDTLPFPHEHNCDQLAHNYNQCSCQRKTYVELFKTLI